MAKQQFSHKEWDFNWLVLNKKNKKILFGPFQLLKLSPWREIHKQKACCQMNYFRMWNCKNTEERCCVVLDIKSNKLQDWTFPIKFRFEIPPFLFFATTLQIRFARNYFVA